MIEDIIRLKDFVTRGRAAQLAVNREIEAATKKPTPEQLQKRENEAAITVRDARGKFTPRTQPPKKKGK